MYYDYLDIATESIEKVFISKVKNLGLLTNYEFDNRYVCDENGLVYLIVNQDRFKYFAKPMRPFTTRDGYTEYVLTTKYGSKKHVQAQRIVCELFNGLPDNPNKKYVNHIDGKRDNNYYKNLEWVTHSENMLHSYKYLRTKNK